MASGASSEPDFRAAELERAAVALYGRFLTAPRRAYVAALEIAGARIARDLRRGTDLLVVGLGVGALAAKGALDQRLSAARARGVPIYGEERLRDRLRRGAAEGRLPLTAALKGASLEPAALGMLAALDVVRLDGAGADETCRFEDAGPLRQAARLIADGFSPFEAARTLRRARGAPPGRREVVSVGDGPALAWDDGAELTALDGQRFLPLDMPEPPTEEDDEFFEAAVEAEWDGDFGEAARLYAEAAARDAQDPVAPYNLANLQREAGALDDAILSYHLAISREPAFVEAHYNLAVAYEAAEALDKAEATLEAALRIDPAYEDALFNLGQLKLKRGAYPEARAMFEAYLAEDPPADWAATARKAPTVIAAAGRG